MNSPITLHLSYSSQTQTVTPIDFGEPYRTEILNLPAVNINVQGNTDFWTVEVPYPLFINAIVTGRDFSLSEQPVHAFIEDALNYLT